MQAVLNPTCPFRVAAAQFKKICLEWLNWPGRLKTVYYTVVVHNFNLQEKTTSTVEVTINFVKKFKAHFEKKLLY